MLQTKVGSTINITVDRCREELFTAQAKKKAFCSENVFYNSLLRYAKRFGCSHLSRFKGRL